MRVVKIEGEALELLRDLLTHVLQNDSVLEVAIDSEGFKVRTYGMWTPGYGTTQPATR